MKQQECTMYGTGLTLKRLISIVILRVRVEVAITVVNSMTLRKKEICVVSPAESCNDSFGAARTRTFPFSSDSAYNHMYIIHDVV